MLPPAILHTCILWPGIPLWLDSIPLEWIWCFSRVPVWQHRKMQDLRICRRCFQENGQRKDCKEDVVLHTPVVGIRALLLPAMEVILEFGFPTQVTTKTRSYFGVWMLNTRPVGSCFRVATDIPQETPSLSMKLGLG